MVIATIGPDSITLNTVLTMVEERHAPGLRADLPMADGNRELNSPLVPLWVRLYVDYRILRDEAVVRNLTLGDADALSARALQLGFEAFKEQFARRRQKEGHPIKWTTEREAQFLPRFRREEGLKADVKALLDLLVSDQFKASELQAYHGEHGDYFGGEVSISHILVRHRDPGTGRLLAPATQASIEERVRDIASRLRPDGLNFAAAAQRYSDDTATQRTGGALGWFTRLDQTLPAVIVREAWRLKDGEWTGPVESPEGLHFVRRDSFSQKTYVFYQGKDIDRVRAHKRAVMQEDLIFDLRSRRGTRLKI